MTTVNNNHQLQGNVLNLVYNMPQLCSHLVNETAVYLISTVSILFLF